MNLRARLSENLRAYRKLLKLTQKELSKLSGVNTTHIGYIENAQVSASVDVLENLATALKIDPCLLLARNLLKFPGVKVGKTELSPVRIEKGEACFAFWTDEGMEFHKITKNSLWNSITILALLQANGYTGKDLVLEGKKLHLPVIK